MNFKTIFNKTCRFLVCIGVVLCILGNFLIKEHIALSNLSLLGIGIFAILWRLISKNWLLRSSWMSIIMFMSMYIIYIIAMFIHSENKEDIITMLQFKSILVGYCLAIIAMPVFERQEYFFFMGVFVFTVIGLCTNVNFSILHYAYEGNSSWEVLHKVYSNIPFNIIHHLLSIFIIVGLFFSIIFWELYLHNKPNLFIKFFFGLLFLYMIISLHAIASRSGLIIFYLVLCPWMVITFFKQSLINFKLKALLVAFVLAISFILIQNFPILNAKVNQAKYDIQFILNNPGSNERLYSYTKAYRIIRENFWLGISFGKSNDIFKKFNQDYVGSRNESGIKPHNQFLYYACIFGVPLTILYVCFMYSGFFVSKVVRNNKYIIIYFIIHTTYCLIDTPMEIKEYYYFFVFWTPFLIKYSYDNSNNLNPA